MKRLTKQDIKRVASDRWWLSLAVLNVITAVAIALAISLKIEPRSAQVIIRYSSFSTVGHYYGYWYHLWSYVALILVALPTHIVLSVKLYGLKRRGLALALLGASEGMILMILIFALATIRNASIG